MIDCLLIGHNEVDFARYEQILRGMGTDSGAYKDLEMNFIRVENKPYSVTDIYNLYQSAPGSEVGNGKPLSTGDTFGNAIAYLGTYLHRRGYRVRYVNSFQDDKEELKRILETGKIRAVAIVTTLYVTPIPIVDIVEYVKRYNPETRIIVGGPFISTQVRVQDAVSLEHLFDKVIGADIYVNSSQGEAALAGILEALKDPGTPDKIKEIDNIYYKTPEGYRATPTEPENNRLAENLVDWNRFADGARGVVNVRTSISCPFSCSFCGFPERAGVYQTVGPEQMMQELEALEKIETVKMVNFIDDTFNVPPKRFKEMLRQMIKKKFSLKWASNLRAQYVDREIVQLMKESGCEAVFLGIESGSNRILENMNKAATVERYREGIDLLREHDIITMGSFIVGFPGETDETVEETVRFIRESGIDFYQVQLWYCEPITPIWREREKYGIEGESFEWSHNTMDSKRASCIVNEIFLTIDTPVYVPQYNFSFDKIWDLTGRGMSREQVKRFLTAFNDGIKQKLREPTKRDIGADIMKRIGETLRGDDEAAEEEIEMENDLNIDADSVRFNF